MLTSDIKTALIHLDAGRAADALPILARIVEKWPNYAAAQIAYGRALQEAGDTEASFRAWTRAEKLVSRSEVVRSGLVRAASALFDDVALQFETAPTPPAVPETDTETNSRPRTEDVPTPDAGSPLGALAGGIARVDDSTVDDSVAARHADVEQDFREDDASSSGFRLAESEPAHDDASAGQAAEEEMPEYAEGSAMDPAFFVPIAVPIEEAVVPDTDAAEWADDAGHSGPASESSEKPRWEGEFTGDAGDGAGTDFDLDAPQPPDEMELDRLIGELERARIVPADDPSSIPSPDLSDDIDDVVSETLARIYATQKQYSEAARVYERLALENPDRAEEFALKASEMRGRAQ